MSFVIFINGLVMVFFAALMGVVALIFPDTSMMFEEVALLSGFMGGALALVSSPSTESLRPLHTFLLTSSVWMVAALCGALPLYAYDLSLTDAVFEAMSGITTTGSTVMSGLDDTPHGIILWRAILQAVGGVGFIVTGIALLPILKVGGMQLFRSESSETGERELRNATMFASATLQIYFALIVVCGGLYYLGGMSAFDAVTHAMTTLSTGGYSGYDASFGHFDSAFLQWTCTLFMLCGALPFSWYIRGLRHGIWKSEQVSAMLICLAAAIAILSAWLMYTRGEGLFDALRLVAFNVVSVVTTTGYATTDYTLWGPFAVVAFFVLTASGGATGSTAGGAKAMRWLVAYRALKAQIRRSHAPHRITTVKYEGRPVAPDALSGVIAFFVLYAASFGVLASLLSFFGQDMTTAITGALTALANVGPGMGDIIGPAGNFATLNTPSKLVLTFGMYLGRLEMATVFALFAPLFWRELVTTR